MRRALRSGFERLDKLFDVAFPLGWNPLLQLGALGWFFYWIVIVSGVYLYIFFDTGIDQAYQSIEYLTYKQWYAGGVMRSLHRYASDALVAVVLLHFAREYVMDRFRGPRWFAWVTGVALLWFIYISGISGYWMVWDKLAQYIAIATTEWFDSLPLFGKSVARNFLNNTTLSGRFFTLMIFIHIAVPLSLVFGMWIHIQRHTLPKVNPPRGLALGTLTMLLILSLILPARSQGPADLDKVPAVIGLDWFYLPIYPLLDHYSGAMLWGLLAGATLLLAALPWLPAKAKRAVAEVNLENCNGCSRCVGDCPYSALTMTARTDGTAYEQQVVVNPSLCLSCGLCVAACPTASPFRRRTQLNAGIELPEMRLQALRQSIINAAQGLKGEGRVIVFGCQSGPELNSLAAEAVATIQLPCIGMLPPSFMDYILSRKMADGILLSGCREGDCNYRLGIEWTQQRLARERDPHLRNRVPMQRIRECWAGVSGGKRLAEELNGFRQHLHGRQWELENQRAIE